MKVRLLLLWLVFGMLFTAESQVLNIERERIVTDTTGWSGTGKFSFNLISNVQKFTELGLNLHVQYKTKRSLWLALSDYEVIKSSVSDFSNKGLQHFRYNYKLNNAFTAEAFSQVQFNKVLNLNFRGLAGAGLRIKILGKEQFRLYSGLAYMFEYEEPSKLDFVEYNHRISTYLSMTYRLNDNFTLINTSYYQPRIDYFTDFRFSDNLDIIFKITKRMSYVLSLEYIIDNKPLPGIPGDIYSLKNSLVFDFGK
ncbi:MAG: DUF481 domain-containing protein [Lentimicrobium sp.]|nr:DUF481 domain-containing protein [Lentimicrobium sp.]